MKVGLDTGFLIRFYLQEREALEWWRRFLKKDVVMVTGVLCGYEFFKVLMS